MKKYKIVDLFAGCGGFSYGFSQLDEFEIIMANEIEKDISIAYTLNHPNVNMINSNICDLTKNIIKSGESCNVYSTKPYNEFLKWARKRSKELLTEHIAPKNGEHLIRIMEALKDGQSKEDLPEELKPKSGYGNTYAKLWWEKPSTTITRNFSCPSSSRCIHPRDSRAMSIREGARLQSFPDDYKFYGSNTMKRLEIGNAVPPLLSIAIANKMLEAIKRAIYY